MIEELENEVSETRVIVSKLHSNELKNIEESNNKLKEEKNQLQSRLEEISNELSKTKSSFVLL